MTTKLPMYEGDGYFHAGSKVEPVPAATTTPAEVAPVPEIKELEAAARRLRNEAVAAMIAKAIAWFKRLPGRAQTRSDEQFLGDSVDHADLERRMRQLERSRRPSYL